MILVKYRKLFGTSLTTIKLHSVKLMDLENEELTGTCFHAVTPLRKLISKPVAQETEEVLVYICEHSAKTQHPKRKLTVRLSQFVYSLAITMLHVMHMRRYAPINHD